MFQKGLAVLTGALLCSVAVGTAVMGGPGGRPRPVRAAGPLPGVTRPAPVPPAAGTSTTTATAVSGAPFSTSRASSTVPVATTSDAAASVSAVGPAVLAGCPVPYRPEPPSPPPWHPAVLVPDSSLPAAPAPKPWTSSLAAISGKGMWIWEWSATEGGDAAAVVGRARAAGLHQLWVRVGDSKDGFYGAAELQALVPAAHAAGLSVVAWGFPYLYDPLGDAAWTAQILGWRGPGGQKVDAVSADIEQPSEGVALSARRVAVYLSRVRAAAGSTPVIATVYPPLDAYWDGSYPYTTMATYVDAFAPMVYWECVDPGQAVTAAIQRLARLRPVHPIGQAFDLAAEGGRVDPPSGAEITEFLTSARQAGAVGASFWVWQSATPEEWAAVSAFRW